MQLFVRLSTGLRPAREWFAHIETSDRCWRGSAKLMPLLGSFRLDPYCDKGHWFFAVSSEGPPRLVT